MNIPQITIVSPTECVLEINPTLSPSIYIGGGGGGGGGGVTSIANSQGSATGAVTLSGTSVKISKTGNNFDFAVDPSNPFFSATVSSITAGNFLTGGTITSSGTIAVDPTAPFYSATMSSLTAGTGLTGGTITSSGTIAADFGTTAGKIAEGNHTHSYSQITGNIPADDLVDKGTISIPVNEGNVIKVRKQSAGTITKGQIVRVVGSTGSHLEVELAQADTEVKSATTIGVAATSITSTADGYVMTSGRLNGLTILPTATFNDGDQVYLDEVVLGGVRAGLPDAPNHGVLIGYCVSANNGGAGILDVAVDNYLELEELSDVYIDTGTLATGHILSWKAGAQRWENGSPGFGPFDAQYVTLATNSTLTSERVLTVGDHITLDDGGAGGNVTLDWLYNPRKDIFLFNECHAVDNMATSNANGGSTGFNDGFIASSEQVGIARTRSGATTNGRAHFGSTTTDQILFGTRAHKFESRTRVQNLSTATDRFEAFIGFYDAFAIGSMVDGAWFQYRDDINTGKFECITSSNSTATTTDSGITVASTDFYKFTILVNTAGTEVKFYIDDVLVATHTTNIPTGSGRNTGFGVCLRKTGTGAGTADRFLTTDYINLEITGQNR